MTQWMIGAILALSSWQAVAEECGIAWPMRFENGRTAMVCGAALTKQRIFIYVNIRPGEMPWRPTYGFSLADLCADPENPIARAAAKEYFIKQIETNIPDIRVRDVEFEIVENSEPLELEMHVDFEIASDGSRYAEVFKYKCP